MSRATEAFDPYLEWLGIEPREMPADHYRLLGLPRFESDAARIAAAADERMAKVRSQQTGPRGLFTNKLLNELSVARHCLLSPQAKSQYDELLFCRLTGRAPPAATPGPSAPPGPVPMAVQLLTYPTQAGPTLEPPLAAPPVAIPLTAPKPPPRQAKKSELAVDVDKPLAKEEEPAESPSRWRLWAGMLLAILLVAVGTWGAGMYFSQRGWFSRNPGEKVIHPDGEETYPDASRNAEKVEQDPAAKAVVVMQEGNREVNLPPAAAVLSRALALRPLKTENVITGWTSSEDTTLWKFKLVEPGFFNLELTYAAEKDADGARLEMLMDKEPLHTFTLAETGGTDQFQQTAHTVVVTSSGTHNLLLRLAGELPADALAIKGIRLTPVGSSKETNDK